MFHPIIRHHFNQLFSIFLKNIIFQQFLISLNPFNYFFQSIFKIDYLILNLLLPTSHYYLIIFKHSNSKSFISINHHFIKFSS